MLTADGEDQARNTGCQVGEVRGRVQRKFDA